MADAPAENHEIDLSKYGNRKDGWTFGAVTHTSRESAMAAAREQQLLDKMTAQGAALHQRDAEEEPEASAEKPALKTAAPEKTKTSPTATLTVPAPQEADVPNFQSDLAQAGDRYARKPKPQAVNITEADMPASPAVARVAPSIGQETPAMTAQNKPFFSPREKGMLGWAFRTVTEPVFHPVHTVMNVANTAGNLAAVGLKAALLSTVFSPLAVGAYVALKTLPAVRDGATQIAKGATPWSVGPYATQNMSSSGITKLAGLGMGLAMV